MGIAFRNAKVLTAVMLAVTGSIVSCKREHSNAKAADRVTSQSAQSSSAATPADFLALLQRALQSGDRAWITAATRFPVQVGEAGTTLDEPAYVQGFANVWNPETVKAVLNQTANQLGASDHFVLGCGEVWFERIGNQHFAITAFKVSAYSSAGIALPDCYHTREFVQQLQTAVAHDSRAQVAGMLKYPLYFHGQHKTLTLHSAQDTLHNYDLIFSDRLRRAVAEQQLWNLLARTDGVAIGDGFMWINEPSEKGPFKVISIFEPPLHY